MNEAEWVIDCLDHKLVQHRDGKPSWCRNCGLGANGKEPVSRLDRHGRGDLLDRVEKAEAALHRVRELHRNSGASQGYTEEGYGNIEDCCGTCGTFGEYGEPWPCPTIRALEGQL